MEVSVSVINLFFGFTLLGILGLFFLPVKTKPFWAAATVILNSVVSTIPSIAALGGEPFLLVLNGSSYWGNILLQIDPLSAWFILIINFTSITGAIYGIGYLKKYDNTPQKLTLHWILFIIFHLSMVWVCMLQHSLVFLVAWEVMSLSSMLLVIFDHQKPKTLKAGINYLVQMHISVTLLTIGFIWVYAQTGTFSFSAFETFFSANSNIWLFIIFFVGFGIKAGFVPLHTWLPHAHPAAPSHISGVMSGVIVKLGIYGIFRVISFLRADFLLLGEIVLTISLVTGFYGILNAAVHRDFKQMLAYCTIENIGIVGMGIGLGLMGMGNGSPLLYYLGFGGALLHVLNHSLFKSLLFFSAGSVYQQTHTRDMNKLGGLIKNMPVTAGLFLIGSVAIGGLPPFNGFVSEFILYVGFLEGLKTGSISEISLLVISMAGLSIIGGISILTFTKTFGMIFLGTGRTNLTNQPKEVSQIMLFPQYLIVGLMLSIAFYPQLYMNTVMNLLQSFNASGIVPENLMWKGYSSSLANINLYSLFFIVIILIVWIARSRFMVRLKTETGSTWGCGYVAPNSKMQYTGKSYSKTMGKMFSFIVFEGKKYKELEKGEIFPKPRKYQSYYLDFFETRIFNFITHQLVYAVNYFKFIQNGRIQSYVWYGIIFMISIFILTVLNILK